VLLREVLRRPDVTPLLLASVVGRFPLGMVPLALVLHVRHSGGDYAAAGALAAAWTLGLAVGTPLLGRALDRRGLTPVLAGSAAVSTLGLAAVVLLPTVPALPALVAAAVAGAATPPLEPALRALWPALVPVAGLERAYSVDATAQELIFVGGPVVVAVGVAVAPAGGLALAVVLLLAGTALFALRDAVRAWRSPPSAQRHWAGPLREPALFGGYGLLVVVGAGVGALTVVATAYGEAAGSSTLGPVLVAANGLGALIGGLAVAVRPGLVPRRLPQPLRLPALAVALGLAYLPLAAAGTTPGRLAAALVTGLPLPALLTACYLDVDRLAPTGTAAEAFGWIITAFLLGSSAGAAAAGALADHGRPALAVALGAAAIITAGAALGLARAGTRRG
jgi:MFS family permease